MQLTICSIGTQRTNVWFLKSNNLSNITFKQSHALFSIIGIVTYSEIKIFYSMIFVNFQNYGIDQTPKTIQKRLLLSSEKIYIKVFDNWLNLLFIVLLVKQISSSCKQDTLYVILWVENEWRTCRMRWRLCSWKVVSLVPDFSHWSAKQCTWSDLLICILVWIFVWKNHFGWSVCQEKCSISLFTYTSIHYWCSTFFSSTTLFHSAGLA